MRTINKKLYLLFIVLILFSLVLKILNRHEDSGDEDYYSNRKVKKENTGKIPEIDYNKYKKRKNVKMNTNYDIFNHNGTVTNLQPVISEKEVEVKNTNEKSEEIVPFIVDESQQIKDEIGKISFSGFVNTGSTKKLYFTYNGELVEIKSGEPIKVFVGDNSYDIYTNYHPTDKLVVFYESKHGIEIEKEI